MIGHMLSRLLDPRVLPPDAVHATFDRLVEPEAPDAERAAILVALAARPPRVEELTRFALEMRRRARPFHFPDRDAPIDLCGSGGAPRPSFNVSTVSAFVVAAAGVPVVKHGNRSARGICGSSDLLLALGLPVTSSIPFADASYRRYKLAFLHAPLYHPATASVAAVRRTLGIPTIFNRLGPLANPGRVAFQVVGAPDASVARLFAAVLGRLGVRKGLAMSSVEGTDEFSPRHPTLAVLWTGRSLSRRRVEARPLLSSAERRGDWGPLAPRDAAQETERILHGALGARRGSVLLTSGAALWVSGRAPRLADGVALARATLDSGSAGRLLEEMRELAGKFPAEAP